jgi:hypothetical protein
MAAVLVVLHVAARSRMGKMPCFESEFLRLKNDSHFSPIGDPGPARIGGLREKKIPESDLAGAILLASLPKRLRLAFFRRLRPRMNANAGKSDLEPVQRAIAWGLSVWIYYWHL